MSKPTRNMVLRLYAERPEHVQIINFFETLPENGNGKISKGHIEMALREYISRYYPEVSSVRTTNGSSPDLTVPAGNGPSAPNANSIKQQEEHYPAFSDQASPSRKGGGLLRKTIQSISFD